jgi:hypothetical protein
MFITGVSWATNRDSDRPKKEMLKSTYEIEEEEG